MNCQSIFLVLLFQFLSHVATSACMVASQGLNFHEDFGHTVSDVFIIHPQRLPRFAGYRCVDFADHLLAGFIHAYHRIIGIIRQVIDLQNILHRQLCRGRDYPIRIYDASRSQVGYSQIQAKELRHQTLR